MTAGAFPVLLAALGGAAVVVAAREWVGALPSLLGHLEAAASTFALAGRENRPPTERERRRLGVVAGALLGLLAVVLTGFGPLAGLAAAGPALAGWAVARRRRRYRLRVEGDVAPIAAGIADSVASGGSLRIALLAVGTGLNGPSAVEMARVGADLELGMSARRALEALLLRVPSERVDALVAAILSQERAGGDLARSAAPPRPRGDRAPARREGGPLGDGAGEDDRRDGRRHAAGHGPARGDDRARLPLHDAVGAGGRRPAVGGRRPAGLRVRGHPQARQSRMKASAKCRWPS